MSGYKQVYSGINAFSLFTPNYDGTQPKSMMSKRWENKANHNEFIEIKMKKNELPTVKLRTYVLYYRDNGDQMTSSQPGTGSTVIDNYRFYNNISASTGKQLGWIWGFPLFDVGRGNNSDNWPRWKSGASATYGGNTTVYPNDTMLVDISTNEQNIIILDFTNYGIQAQTDAANAFPSSITDSWKDISNNIDGVADAFYMTLRVKWSTENAIDCNNSHGTGKDGCWNPYPKDATSTYGIRLTDHWCTLVEYVYECDLIGPKTMLDFTPSLFVMKDWTVPPFGESRLISGYNSNGTRTPYIGVKKYSTFSEEETIKIKTGTGIAHMGGSGGYPSGKMIYNMSPGSIIIGLTLDRKVNLPNHVHLKVKTAYSQSTFSGTTPWTMTKIIGGWCNFGVDIPTAPGDIDDLEGYYGSIQGTSTNPNGTNASRESTYQYSKGWKNDIELYNTGMSNIMQENNFLSAPSSLAIGNSKCYDLNNILWCSIRSPRKKKVVFIGSSSAFMDKNKFITNFIDLEGINDCSGGGFARYPNTIDMPRKSWAPYYSDKPNQQSSTDPIINENTVSITDFSANKDINYLKCGNTPLGLYGNTAVNAYTVYYKLLIPPVGDASYNISYTFGKTQSNVTTFFRHTDMDGIPEPSGNTNLYAKRDEESILLDWSSNSITEKGEMPIKKITFLDVASGFKHVTANITVDGTLQDASNNEIYDISFNVFQLHFYSKDSNNLITYTDRNEIPYTIKPFDSNIQTEQYIDISYTPVNYEPYRYINYANYNNNSEEYSYYDNTMFPNAPVYTREERLLYNPRKLFTKVNTDLKNANVIEPSGSDVVPEIYIDISGDKIYDNSYSIIPSDLTAAQNQANQGQEIAVFDKENLGSILYTIENNDNTFLVKDGAMSIIDGINIKVPFFILICWLLIIILFLIIGECLIK